MLLVQRYVSPFPTDTSESHDSIGVGLRWSPFAPDLYANKIAFPFPAAFIAPNAPYVTAILGADLRDRQTWVSPTQSTAQVAWSPIASLAFGLPEIQGGDWTLGPELREQLQYFDGHVQRAWMLLITFELRQW